MKRTQSLGEEIANSITHGIGIGLSIAALVLLVVFSSLYGNAWRVVSFSIYGATLISLYLASTLYHSVSNERAKRFFQVFDHISIYLLIAGTYTPISLTLMRGPWGWTIFGVVWTMAISGILYETVLKGRYKIISLIIYTVMGWIILIAFKPMLTMLPKMFIVWLFIGGLCYSFGIIFYVWKKLPYQHMIWHLFVLAGSITQFFGMFFYLTSIS